MSKLVPKFGNVTLRPIEKSEQTFGNIVIPDMGHEQPLMAEVIAVSDIFNFNTENFIPNEIEVGMKVFVPKMGGVKIMLDNEEYWIIQSNQILAILEE